MLSRITVPIFDTHIYIGNDSNEAKVKIREESGLSSDDSIHDLDNCCGICYIGDRPNESNYWMLLVFDWEASTVVHESVHMARIILNHCGVVYSQKNDEILAYLSAYIYDKAMGILFPKA